MEPVRATVDADSRLIVRPRRHEVSWLTGEQEIGCVVEVLARGQVRVWALARWAEAADLPEKDAKDQIQAFEFEPLGPGSLASGTFLRTANKKNQIYEIELPDMAVFALFAQGEGPMAVRKGRREGNSGKVLLVSFERFVELWGHAIL